MYLEPRSGSRVEAPVSTTPVVMPKFATFEEYDLLFEQRLTQRINMSNKS